MSTMRTTAWIAIALMSSLLVSQRLFAAGLNPNWRALCDYDEMFSRTDHTIFGRDCSLCHSMGGPWAKPGGPLNGLFQRKLLMTGKLVTEENIRKQIADGGPGMPGFKYTLTRKQIDGLVRYLKTANCPQDLSLELAKAQLKWERELKKAKESKNEKELKKAEDELNILSLARNPATVDRAQLSSLGR